jgi:hypothetical protein
VVTAHRSDDSLGLQATIRDLFLLDGSEFILDTNAQILSRAHIGEPVGTPVGRQPVFRILDGNRLSCVSPLSGVPYDVLLNARLEMGLGSLLLQPLVNLRLLGGGEISRADIRVDTASVLTVEGYALRMMTYDAFDLTLSHRFILPFLSPVLLLISPPLLLLLLLLLSVSSPPLRCSEEK